MEWQGARGKWQEASGKWQVASGKWQVASGWNLSESSSNGKWAMNFRSIYKSIARIGSF
jgi:hypothetical protein